MEGRDADRETLNALSLVIGELMKLDRKIADFIREGT
jgi:hypothetical protein